MGRITNEQIARMRRLSAMGSYQDDTADPAAGAEELELIHLTDVIEMQRLLREAADELDRLYSSR